MNKKKDTLQTVKPKVLKKDYIGAIEELTDPEPLSAWEIAENTRKKRGRPAKEKPSDTSLGRSVEVPRQDIATDQPIPTVIAQALKPGKHEEGTDLPTTGWKPTQRQEKALSNLLKHIYRSGMDGYRRNLDNDMIHIRNILEDA